MEMAAYARFKLVKRPALSWMRNANVRLKRLVAFRLIPVLHFFD
jgi:hypothetical protein